MKSTAILIVLAALVACGTDTDGETSVCPADATQVENPDGWECQDFDGLCHGQAVVYWPDSEIQRASWTCYRGAMCGTYTQSDLEGEVYATQEHKPCPPSVLP